MARPQMCHPGSRPSAAAVFLITSCLNRGWMLNFVTCFFCTSWYFHTLSFILLTCCIAVVDFKREVGFH